MLTSEEAKLWSDVVVTWLRHPGVSTVKAAHAADEVVDEFRRRCAPEPDAAEVLNRLVEDIDFAVQRAHL